MFLRRLNSSEPVYLGQTGLGNAEERGRLSLMCQASRASGITSITNLAGMWTSLWSNGSTVADPVSGIIPVHPVPRDERSARRRTINQRDNFQRNGVR
uniref:Uncharacterized protein n=1 Tax=Ciona savignyi TaxID=51511 RepID=H2Z1X8_CIOSA